MTDEEKQELIDAMKAESQSVDELEEVTSLDNVKSLPAMRGEEVVSVPVSLLSEPATTAAKTAETAATKATEAAETANTAAETANTAAETATKSASKAESAAATANEAAETANEAADKTAVAMEGATARFGGFIDSFGDDVTLNGSSDDEFDASDIYFVVANNKFYAADSGYFSTWKHSDLYNDESTDQLLKDKTYLCGGKLYAWSDEEGTLVEISGSGSGSGFYNVTAQIPLTSGYYTIETAVAALETADIEDDDKPGMIITFETSEGVWADYRFISDDLTKLTDTAAWEEYGGGKVKSVSLNGEAIEPDAGGNVNIKMDTIEVDESLDTASTNPVQNKVVAAKLTELESAAVGSVEVVIDDDKNTLTIYNKQGAEIASAEFTGGSGSGTSTASRISLVSSIDKSTVKEGGEATLSYTYNHLNSDNEADGIKATITVTVKSGTVTTFEQTHQNVAAGTYTIDISKYLVAGTVDVYVKAEATAEDGTAQTKQVYKSITVVALTLTSSYNLATPFSTGGYRYGDTIEIPYAITGSGTKNISMYLDGGTTPTVQTVSKSGTSNGSFTIQAGGLAAGVHSVQIVAERDGLLSDSIYMTILKYGSEAAAVLVKLTDTTGEIITGDGHLSPTIKGEQYSELTFNYAAYDPSGTPATVGISLDGGAEATVSVPRSTQTYTTRLTTQGEHTLAFTVGGQTYSYGVEIEAGSTDVAETTYGLVAKLDATGRSNTESDPAEWSSDDIKTAFEGFDWSSNGWDGTSLKLTNGAKAVIGYQPFATDVKSTGLTLEITLRVQNVVDRESAVVSCLDNGKGLQITAEKVSFKTGQTVTYTNEDDETVTRDVELKTNYVDGEWFKVCLTIDTAANNRLMELYMNGNRAGADQYDTSFNFQQDTPQDITISSEGADVEIRSIRVYSRAISDDEELENHMVDALTATEMVELYEENDVLGEDGGIDIDAIRKKGKGVMLIVRANKLTDVYTTNNKKTDFTADIYYYSPFGEEYDLVVKNCYIRIQGTSSTKYPSKNIRVYLAKGTEYLSMTIGGAAVTENKYALRPGGIAMSLLCAKSDYSDSSMSMNTGGAKLFNDMMKELGLLTPPQQYQYEQGGDKTSAITVRTAIDGVPMDMFVAETADSVAEFVGQYNLNNEKSKSQDLFGMDNVEGYTPECPMCLETLNNTEECCLFQSGSDDDVAANFDDGLETNYPDDVGWDGLTEAQQTAVKDLFAWIRACKPADAESGDISSWKSDTFKSGLSEHFDVGFLCCYYLFTDYEMAVDQRAKNMLLRTWDGKIWYITYYDGDTKYGKRNDCFLVYDYTLDRDTYDAEAAKYAFEGRDSWLWNMLLANFGDELKEWAGKMRAVLTVEKVEAMYLTEQIGNWSDREYNKSGELKYIQPAIQTMYGKVWPFIYALQGANKAHMQYIIENRFALLDAKYGTSSFQSDNIDFYLSRESGDTADVVKITGSEVYAYGYGTNNSPNIQTTGVVEGGTEAQLTISAAYTVNDPLRMYGASRMKTLDMTSAASHLKNGFDLSKCVRLRELLMNTTGTPSSGWWLTIESCTALQKVNLKGQTNAKTGSSTSSELNFEKQTRLEYLDARGTKVTSVVVADGAPITTLALPSTLTTLRLQHLQKLTDDGLTVEGYSAIQTLLFTDCPNLDWETIAGRCGALKRLRVEGIDAEGDGTLLDTYMSYGGVDADGNYTDTCALVGTYRLTKYMEDEQYETYAAHYPELNIVQPEYTMIEFDESVSDDANVSNLDNETGYKYGTDYAPSGHISAILKKRHRVLAKVTAKPTTRSVTIAGVETTMNNLDGEMTYFPLHDDNSNYYADAESVSGCTEAALDGSEGDWMMYEPRFWMKGVNDYLNQKNYSCYSSNAEKPASPEATVLTLDDIKAESGGYVSGNKIMSGKTTLANSYSADSSYSVCKVTVEGYKRVRFPSVPGTNLTGSIFTDADGAVVDTIVVPTLSNKFEAGMYLIYDVPEGAVALHFSILNTAEFDKVVLSDSDRIEDMEPEWAESEEHLCAVVGSSVVGTQLRAAVTGGTTAASMTWTDFHYYSAQRGMQQIDALMHSRIANLFYAKYGRRNSQEQCGAGQHTTSRVTGGTASHGMTDTIGYEEAYAINSGITNSLVDNLVHQYAWYKSSDGASVTQVNNTCCMGYEDIYGNKYDMMDGVDLPNDTGNSGKWRIWMPDGTTRMVKGTTTSGQYITAVAHGQHMDVIPVGTVAGSSSTYYSDMYWVSTSAGRVVYRGYNFANAYGGVSYANAYYDASYSSTHVGSRLAFRGKIVRAASVAAYKALDEEA